MEDESNNHLNARANVSYDWGESFKALFSREDFDGSDDSRSDVDSIDEGRGDCVKVSDSLDTVPLSLPKFSSDEIFQVNPPGIPQSRDAGYKLKSEACEPFNKSGQINILNRSFSDVPQESSLPHTSQTQSPPIQVMGRSGGMDHNRIMVSIHSNRSSDWSTISNDSLFSLPFTADGLPPDPALWMSEMLYRSGKLPNTEELFISPEFYPSREFCPSTELPKPGDPKRASELSKFRRTFHAGKGSNEMVEILNTIAEDMIREGTSPSERCSDVHESYRNDMRGNDIRESGDTLGANCYSASSENRKYRCQLCLRCCCSRACCYFPCNCCCNWANCCLWKRSYSCCCRSCHCWCPTWSNCCFKWPPWPSCKCCGSNCSWRCCNCCGSNCSWRCCNCCCCHSNCKSNHSHYDLFYQ